MISFSLTCFVLMDALSLTEFELMELLDVGLADVTLAVALISEIVSPPYQTVIGSLLCWYTWGKTSINRVPKRLQLSTLTIFQKLFFIYFTSFILHISC